MLPKNALSNLKNLDFSREIFKFAICKKLIILIKSAQCCSIVFEK